MTRVCVYAAGVVVGEHMLANNGASIGRDPANTIVLRERNISRRHCRLQREGKALFVDNVSSRYGTRINGKPLLHRSRLFHGDSLRLGDFTLVVLDEALGARDAHELNARESANETTAFVRTTTAPAVPPPKRRPLTSPFALLTRSPVAFERWRLESTVTTIGSGSSNDIVLSESGIAPNHARIEIEGGRIVLVACEGAVRVGDEVYARTKIADADVVHIGDSQFAFMIPDNFLGCVDPTASANFTATVDLGQRRASAKTWIYAGVSAVIIAACVLTAMMSASPQPIAITAAPAPASQPSQLPEAASAVTAPPPTLAAPPVAQPATPSALSALSAARRPGVKRQSPDAALAVQPAQPLSPDAQVDEALAHAQKGDPRSAIAQLERVVAQSPTLARAFYNLGVLYDRENNVPAALDAYRRFLALDPEHVSARKARARITTLEKPR